MLKIIVIFTKRFQLQINDVGIKLNQRKERAFMSYTFILKFKIFN